MVVKGTVSSSAAQGFQTCHSLLHQSHQNSTGNRDLHQPGIWPECFNVTSVLAPARSSTAPCRSSVAKSEISVDNLQHFMMFISTIFKGIICWLVWLCGAFFGGEAKHDGFPAVSLALCLQSSVSRPKYEEVQCKTRRRISMGMVMCFLLLQK